MFHLLDEEEFMRGLHEFYEDPSERIKSSRMWFIQFLLVLAFGKAFLSPQRIGNLPSGSDFFIRAMTLLPNTEYLYGEPILAVEILCLASLYLQSVDMRRSAYSHVRA